MPLWHWFSQGFIQKASLKTNIAGKIFRPLKSYITSIHKIPNFIPNTVFKQGPRCSELRIDIKTTQITKQNNVTLLAGLAQTIAKTKKQRHEIVENFLLINDNDTIAIEVPVYIKPEELTKQEQKEYGLNLDEPLSGHIDILQVRFNQIHILDYKPNAVKNDKSTIDQLFLYSIALSKRINVPLRKIVATFFDEYNYFQIQY